MTLQWSDPSLNQQGEGEVNDLKQQAAQNHGRVGNFLRENNVIVDITSRAILILKHIDTITWLAGYELGKSTLVTDKMNLVQDQAGFIPYANKT